MMWKFGMVVAILISIATIFISGINLGLKLRNSEPCLSPTPVAAWNGQLKAAGYLKYMCMWSGERYYCVLEQDDK